MPSKFHRYTPGLECNGHGLIAKSVAIAIYRNENGSVTLQPESAYNMAMLAGRKTISAEQFSARPDPQQEDIAHARWALNLCGWSPMGECSQDDPAERRQDRL